jgi:Effector-associated domain 7
MSWLLVVKFITIIFFLIMFLRRPSLVWGIGLLTVTTAVLLDTLLGTFDSVALRAELGFFYFVISGILFAGGALWLMGLLLPQLRTSSPSQELQRSPQEIVLPVSEPVSAPKANKSSLDRQMIYEDIHERFGREDVLDLMFDLNIHESDVMTVDQDMNQLIINIISFAVVNGREDQLALAVERILTPPPADHLPRLERLTPESPPTVLRQYLLANYSLEELQQLASGLDIDWEQLDAGAKREKTRSLLQYAYRRNRVDDLIDLMQEFGQSSDPKTTSVSA